MAPDLELHVKSVEDKMWWQSHLDASKAQFASAASRRGAKRQCPADSSTAQQVEGMRWMVITVNGKQ